MRSKKRVYIQDKEQAGKQRPHPGMRQPTVLTPQRDAGDIHRQAREKPESLAPADLKQLQGAVGNRAVNELMVQRKTQHIHIDKRLYRQYGNSRANDWVTEVINKVGVYNAIPMDDKDYGHQLQVLRNARKTAYSAARAVDNWGFLSKKGTLRGLGGPFRYPYYMLARNLWKLAGRASYEGALLKEIELVKQQAGLPDAPEPSGEAETEE